VFIALKIYIFCLDLMNQLAAAFTCRYCRGISEDATICKQCGGFLGCEKCVIESKNTRIVRNDFEVKPAGQWECPVCRHTQYDTSTHESFTKIRVDLSYVAKWDEAKK